MALFSKDIETLDDLFVHQLRDIYYAEKQIVKALPKMIDKASDSDLKTGLRDHLDETRNHVARVEQVFEMHGAKAKAVDCPAIDGIIKEANEVSATSMTRTCSMPRSLPRRRPSSITRSPATAR